MQTIHNILKPIAGTAAALAVVVLTGCSSMTTRSEPDRSAGRVLDDKKIASTVKHALNNEPVYKFNDVKVDTYKGIVQLSGFVDTPEQKQKAQEIAKNVPWVRDVVNNLTLKPNDQIPSTTGKATGERKSDSTTKSSTGSSDATTRSNTNSPSSYPSNP
jgi:hyperosmotically inducible protein